MAKWGKADFEQLKELQRKLEKLSQSDIDSFCRDCSKELAARLLRLVIPRTPVGVYPFEDGKTGGTLRRGWTVNGTDFKVYKNGSNYTVTVENPVEYASYVEYGHRQTPGRFVPAIGKRLTKSWVPGKYMLTLSEQELIDMTPAILERKLNKFLAEVFNG